MASVGLIINGRSNRSATVVDDLLYIAKGYGDVRAEVLDGVNGLGNALNTMNRDNVDTLIMAGGDGTLQATFTDSINERRFDRNPYMVALPCGMTNVIANDCGLKGAPTNSLDNFLWRRKKGAVARTRRPLMSVGLGKRTPVHGFFLGAGAFHSAVEYSRSNIQSKGARRSLALFASTVGYILKVAFNPGNALDKIEIDFMEHGGEGSKPTTPQTIFLSTTLNRLGSGIFPFWGTGDGAMVSMTLDHPARRILRAAPAVLRGKSRPWFEEYGYRSWRSNMMRMRFDGPLIFDGELFHAKGDEDLVIDTNQCAEFLQ